MKAEAEMKYAVFAEKSGSGDLINKYVCLGCGNVAAFDEGDGKGYVTSWKCKCGHVNDIADMSKPICSVKIISAED